MDSYVAYSQQCEYFVAAIYPIRSENCRCSGLFYFVVGCFFPPCFGISTTEIVFCHFQFFNNKIEIVLVSHVENSFIY